MTKGRISLCTCSISKYRSVFGHAKTGFNSFRAEKDGGYEHVPPSNLFSCLYHYILTEK